MRAEDIAIGLLFMVAGIVVIQERERIVKHVIKLNNAGWGYYKYGEIERRWMPRQAIVIGLCFIVMGFLVMIGKFWTK